MNLKKGLIRLLVVSLPIVGIYGYTEGSKTVHEVYGLEHRQALAAQEELKVKTCASIVESNPSKFPTAKGHNPFMEDFKGLDPCQHLSYAWDDAKKYQKKIKKTGTIDADDIMGGFNDKLSKDAYESGLREAGISVLSFLLILVICMIIGFILRWVFRGFKTNDNI